MIEEGMEPTDRMNRIFRIILIVVVALAVVGCTTVIAVGAMVAGGIAGGL